MIASVVILTSRVALATTVENLMVFGLIASSLSFLFIATVCEIVGKVGFC